MWARSPGENTAGFTGSGEQPTLADSIWASAAGVIGAEAGTGETTWVRATAGAMTMSGAVRAGAGASTGATRITPARSTVNPLTSLSRVVKVRPSWLSWRALGVPSAAKVMLPVSPTPLTLQLCPNQVIEGALGKHRAVVMPGAPPAVLAIELIGAFASELAVGMPGLPGAVPQTAGDIGPGELQAAIAEEPLPGPDLLVVVPGPHAPGWRPWGVVDPRTELLFLPAI